MPRDAIYDFTTLPAVANADELFRLAAAMEAEAARRYAELAARMADAGHPELAALFRRIEEQEREHEATVAQWASASGHEVASLPDFQWQSPESISEEEIAEAGGESLMTPVSALDLAVHNEERAFSYYVYIATEAIDPEVREYAEGMAEEELGHVALLRLQRRRANHAQREQEGAPVFFSDAPSLRRYAKAQEATAHRRVRRAADMCRASGATEIAHRLAALCSDAGDTDAATPHASDGQTPLELVDDALRHTEALYETYLRTAEQAFNEALVEAAQQWADHVLKRLARLNDCRAMVLSTGGGEE